jgi:hypothetical protein
MSECTRCKQPNAAHKCGRCRIVHYCSRDCQRADWPTHKTMCTSPQAPQSLAAAREEALGAPLAPWQKKMLESAEKAVLQAKKDLGGRAATTNAVRTLAVHPHRMLKSVNATLQGKGSKYPVREIAEFLCDDHGQTAVDTVRLKATKLFERMLPEERNPALRAQQTARVNKAFEGMQTTEQVSRSQSSRACMRGHARLVVTYWVSRKRRTRCSPCVLRCKRLNAVHI